MRNRRQLKINIRYSWHNQQGVGLLEVLVAMLVLGVGMLGMMGLQSESIRYNHNAALRARAAMMASDMMDRIRVNEEHATTTTSYSTTVGTDTGDCTTSWPAACEGSGTNCSPAQLATWDIAQWKHQLSCQLPGGDGGISFTDEPAGRVYTITVQLQEMDTNDNPSGAPMTTTLRSML